MIDITKLSNQSKERPDTALDLACLANDISLCREDGSLDILDQTKTDIHTSDFCEDRDIYYHLVPPTEEWLNERIKFMPSAKKYELWKDFAVSLLMSIDPDMLATLRFVFFVATAEDIDEMVDWIPELTSESLPDQMLVDNDEELADNGVVGQFWSMASSVIINMAAIEKSKREIYEADDLDTETCGDPYKLEQDGIMVTLLHEIRHLGLSNPFLQCDDRSSLMTEENTEAWAREQYEAYLAQ